MVLGNVHPRIGSTMFVQGQRLAMFLWQCSSQVVAMFLRLDASQKTYLKTPHLILRFSPLYMKCFRKNLLSPWEKMRHQLLKASMESEALPPDTLCFVCGLNKASHRCLQCSSSLFYCFSAAHVKTNLFHKGEIWEVSTML